MGAITIPDCGCGPIGKEVDLEGLPIMVVDQTPDGLHPIVILKKRGDVADPRRMIGGSHPPGWV